MAKNEVAVIKSENFDLQVLAGDMAEAIAEEMDGLGTIPFDMVKIPSGGALSFEIPGEDEDNPESTNEITGVILYHHPINGYWATKYDGANNAPDCSSYDGKIGVDTSTGECKNCANCPHNQFGSAEDGIGKACKNMHRCYILREGNPVPILLTLPPSSLKGLRDYLGKKVVLRGMRSYQVITKITLKKDKSSGGIPYSKAVFTAVGTLEGDKLQMAKAFAENIKAQNSEVDITAEDMMPAQQTYTSNTPDPIPESENPFAKNDAEPVFENAEPVQEELPV